MNIRIFWVIYEYYTGTPGNRPAFLYNYRGILKIAVDKPEKHGIIKNKNDY